MKGFIEKHLLVLIATGMIAGGLLGAFQPEAGMSVKFLGKIFLNALKFIVIPLIFTSVATGISSLGDVTRIGKLGRNTVIYYLATTTISVVLGLILVVSFQPGVGGTPPGDAAGRTGKTADDFIHSFVPDNFFRALADGQAIPLIIVAVLFGMFLLKLDQRGTNVRYFFRELNHGIIYLVRLLMLVAPIGIFGLVAGLLASKGGLAGVREALVGLAKYSMVVVIGLTIHAGIILPSILRFLSGWKVSHYARNVFSALLTAFSTASSSATLPETIRCVEDKSGIENETAGFVLPLGATINMDGTALYEAVAAIYIAQSYGVDLGIGPLLVIVLTATIASIGAAGIPEAGLVTMVLVLNSVGLPTEGIALILLVDWLLDRYRTAVNVWGDCVGAAVISHRMRS